MKTQRSLQLIGVVCLLFICSLNGADKTSNQLDMPFYIGNVLPTPQKTTYLKEFLPLAKTAVLTGKNVSNDDLLVRLLRERIESRNGWMKVVDTFRSGSNAETVIVLGDHKLAKNILPPSKTQGYVISMKKLAGKNIIFLKGHDRQGLCWAMSSLIQLITVNNGRAVVEKAEIADFPDIVNRGIWMGAFSGYREFAFNFKINTVVFPKDRQLAKDSDPCFWRKGVNKTFISKLNEIGTFFNPLEIKWFVGIHPILGKQEQKINCASESDLNSIYAICAEIAKAGGNILIKFDDLRFPRNPEEKKVFATAREADTYFIRKLYNKLQKKYPKTDLMFCPAFYWGPAANPGYPESRDEYLKAVGELPKAIRISWNGPHVCTSRITAKDLKWEQDIVKRKPDLFIFRGGPHMFRYHYITDVVDYSNSYYNGFFEGINTYIHCVNMPAAAAVAAHIMNYLWNPDVFKPAESAKMVAEMLIGPDSFKSVDRINKALSYFDQWGLKPSPGAAKEIDVFKEKLKELHAAYNACHEKYPSIAEWSSFKYLITCQERLQKRLSNLDMKQFSQADKILKKLAVKEIGYDSKRDIFFTPYDVSGGHTPQHYQYRCEKRLATWIRGKGTSINKAITSFQLTDKAVSHLNQLAICGQDDDSNKKASIKICLNGNSIFEGPNPFEQFGWNVKRFSIPKGFLKEGRNTLSIELLDKSDIAHGPPFFMLCYAALQSQSK